MAANGKVTLEFGGQQRDFNLAILKYALEHQDLCDAGPQQVLNRLIRGEYRIQDVRETIRLGLMGGGMKPDAAARLTRLYVDDFPWAENVPFARVIMLAAVVGVKDDPLGKKTADQTTTETAASSETAVSSDPLSTAAAPLSDSIPASSTA